MTDMLSASDWQGSWIWDPEVGDKPNTFVLFRRRFTAPSGARALLRVSAGHFYRVFLNGRFVGRGPDRSYFEEKFYHLYDVTKYLKQGANVLAAEVHFLGRRPPNLMDRQAEGDAGLIAQLDVDGRPVVQTDIEWQCRVNPAYSTETELPSMHREWREVYFAGRTLKGWTTVRFDDTDWHNAGVVSPAEGGLCRRLLPKRTAEMTAEPLRALNVHVTNDGWQGGPDYDGFALYNLVSSQPVRLHGPFRVWNDKRERQEILFDMGRVVAGYPKIEFGECGGGTIRVYYGDALDLAHWDTIHLGAEPFTWSPFTLRGGRYFRLEIRGARNPVSIRTVRWVRTNYPVQRRGRFVCSDPQLEQAWQMCALSAETCGMEHFVDCVGREQVLWMMDFRFQAPQHAYYFGDTALARKCFRQFATLQFDNGHILAYGPSCMPLAELQSGARGKSVHDWFGFNFWFLIAVGEHYRYTQDREFLAEMLPVCRKCLDYYARGEVDGWADRGEFGGTYFVEWGYQAPEPGQYAFHQALYYGALQAFAALCRAAGREAEADRIESKASKLELRFFQAFVEPQTNRVCDYLVDGRRHTTDQVQPHTAALLFFDHIPAPVRQASLEVLVGRRLPPSRSGLGVSMAIEALFRQQEPEAALKLCSDYYGAVRAAGLPQTPELYDMAGEKGADCRWSPAYSRCHAYASLAGVSLQQHVLGAVVEGPRVILSPQFRGLERASGTVPTPGGDVKIAWRRKSGVITLRVTAPQAVAIDYRPAAVAVPVNLQVRKIRRPQARQKPVS